MKNSLKKFQQEHEVLCMIIFIVVISFILTLLLIYLKYSIEKDRIYEDRHMMIEVSDKYEDKRIRSVKPISYDTNYYLVLDNEEEIRVSYIVYNKYNIGDDLFITITDVYNKNEDGTKTYVKSIYKLEN